MICPFLSRCLDWILVLLEYSPRSKDQPNSYTFSPIWWFLEHDIIWSSHDLKGIFFESVDQGVIITTFWTWTIDRIPFYWSQFWRRFLLDRNRKGKGWGFCQSKYSMAWDLDASHLPCEWNSGRIIIWIECSLNSLHLVLFQKA